MSYFWQYWFAYNLFFFTKGEKKKTEVIKSELNPTWNEVCHYIFVYLWLCYIYSKTWPKCPSAFMSLILTLCLVSLHCHFCVERFQFWQKNGSYIHDIVVRLLLGVVINSALTLSVHCIRTTVGSDRTMILVFFCFSAKYTAFLLRVTSKDWLAGSRYHDDMFEWSNLFQWTS